MPVCKKTLTTLRLHSTHTHTHVYMFVYIYISYIIRTYIYIYEAGTFMYNVTLSFVDNKTTTSGISHVIAKEAILHNATVEFGKWAKRMVCAVELGQKHALRFTHLLLCLWRTPLILSLCVESIEPVVPSWVVYFKTKRKRTRICFPCFCLFC